MAVYKCKMCGGTIEVTEGQKVVTCEYCGATQTVHSFDNEKKTTFFKRAEALRFKCEFDKAAGVYETIVSEFPHEAEAYWGLVLCKYGIEYVDDPKTGKKIPTCHRTQFASIYEDADYMNVLKYADVVAKTVYEQEAKEISKLQKSILDISSKEDPFDIFICYKENDNNGERTKDSVLAQNIYKELHREGYRIFFARITLEDKLGTQYEPYIFAALHSAKVMLHVTMSAEHSESVWVRNEWSRFLSLIAEGQQKVLIPCYKDMSAYDLPDEMQSLQGQDMSKVGAMQDLVYGIEKIFRKKTNTVEKKEIIEATVGSGSYKGLLKKGYTYLRNGRFDDADSTFDAAIKISEMPGEAYLGKVLAEYQFKTVDEVLETADEVVVDCDNFVMAKEFADEETAKLLKKIEDTLRYNRLKENYDSAMSQYNKGDLENLSLAKDNFIALEDFENSREMVKECTYQMGVVYMSYITSIKALGYCDDATERFEEVIDHKDSKEKINQIGALKEKITSEYKELCISRLSIAYPKTVDYVSLTEVAKRIKDNRAIVFTPNYEEFDLAKKATEDEAIKFFISKCPAYIQSLNQLNDCERLDRLCSSVETNGNLKAVHELISQREKELKEIAAAVRKKKNKKRLKITGIVCAALAVSVATFFGIKAIVDESNRSNTYNAATSYMESGNYDDAIAYYQSLGDYKESQKKIKVCNGLKELEASMTSKSEADMIKGIKTIVEAGEKVDITYETENNVNIRRLAGGNSGNKTETIDNVDFTLYQPIWSGYTFLNWNSDSLSYKNERTYLGAMSNWSLNSYTITYNLDGGTNDSRNPAAYTVESNTINLYDASKTGYTFLGWYEGNEKVTSIQKGTFKDYALTAHWQANNYVITLNPNNGTVSPTSVNVTYDSPYSLPTPTRDYYGFDGWFDSSNHKWTDGTYRTTDNVTLTARWTPTSYTITYVLNNGSNDPRNPTSYTVEDNVTLFDASRTGYTFLGWFDNSHNKVENISQGSHGSITLEAEWQINVYNYSFVNYDGTELQSGTAEYGSSVTYTGPEPTREKDAPYTYTFSGWDNDTSFISDDTVFTAQYSTTLNKYTITWKNYDGTVLDTESLDYGTTPSFKGETPTKPSTDSYQFVFSGWSPTVESVTGDATYTAVFESQAVYQYFLTSGKASISGVSGTGLTKYDIPSTIDGYPVTHIRTNAFKNCTLAEEIVVPSSVTFIQKGAFSGCSSLKSITLPFVGCQRIDVSAMSGNQAQADYIFGYVFGDTEFTNSTLVTTSSISYYLPSGLTNVTINNTGDTTIIPTYGFEYNKIITNVTIKGNIYGLAYEALEFCSSLVSFDCSESIVEVIGGSVFDDCVSLKNVNLGETVTTISDSAFADCGLEYIYLPDSLQSIAEGAFRGCAYMTEMSLPFTGDGTGSTRLFGHIFGPNSSSGFYQVQQYSSTVNIGETYGSSTKAYGIPKTLDKVTIRNDVYTQLAFNRIPVREVVLPAIHTLEEYAFYSSSVQVVSIPLVSNISRYAFYSTPLQELNAPNVTNIGSNAFDYSTLLYYHKDFLANTNVEYISSEAFCHNGLGSEITYLIIPESVQQLGYLVFGAGNGSGYNNLKTYFYEGTAEQWNTLMSNSSNDWTYYSSYTVYFYTESKPIEPGNYWRYVNGEPVIWSYGEGSEANPFTVLAARNLIRTLSPDGYTGGEIYVEGTVSSVRHSDTGNVYLQFKVLNENVELEVENAVLDNQVFDSDTISYYSNNPEGLIGKTVKLHGFGQNDISSGIATIRSWWSVGIYYVPKICSIK